MKEHSKGKFLFVVVAVILALGMAAGERSGAWAQQAKATKITIIEPNRILPFAPLYVAVAKGYFRDEGIEVEILSGGGGAAVNPALLRGEAQFAATASDELLKFVKGGQAIVALLGINTSFTMQTIVSKAFAEKKGLSPKAPLSQKIAALKGATMGGISLGGAHEIFLRYNMVLGGLSPKDVTVVRVGAGPAMIAALEKGQIDGFEYGPPVGREVEQRGSGYIWIDPTEVPQYKNMVWQVLLTRKDYVEKNPKLTQAVVRAMARGVNFLVDHSNEVVPLLRPHFKGTSDKTIEAGLKDVIYTFRRDGRMTREMWDNAVKPMQEMNLIGNVDTKENGFWTNDYIVNVPKD